MQASQRSMSVVSQMSASQSRAWAFPAWVRATYSSRDVAVPIDMTVARFLARTREPIACAPALEKVFLRDGEYCVLAAYSSEPWNEVVESKSKKRKGEDAPEAEVVLHQSSGRLASRGASPANWKRNYRSAVMFRYAMEMDLSACIFTISAYFARVEGLDVPVSACVCACVRARSHVYTGDRCAGGAPQLVVRRAFFHEEAADCGRQWGRMH